MRLFLILFLMLIHTAVLFSQSIALKHYNSRNSGLGQNQVVMINRANDGALLLSTYGGFSRFNGKRFFNYTKKQGLQSNIVFGTIDKDDTLWVATRDGIDYIVNNSIHNYYRNPAFGLYYSRFYSYGDLFFLRDINRPNNKAEKNVNHFFDLRKKRIIDKVFLKDSLAIMSNALFFQDSALFWTSEKMVVASLRDFGARKIKLAAIDSTLDLVELWNDHLYFGKLTKNRLTDRVDAVVKLMQEQGFPVDIILTSNGDFHLTQGQFFMLKAANEVSMLDTDKTLYRLDAGKLKKVATLSGASHQFFSDKNYWWQGNDNGFYKLEIPGFTYYRATDGFPADVWSVLPDSAGRIWFAGFNNEGVQIYDGENLNYTSDKIARLFYNCPLIGLNNEMLFPSHLGVSAYKQTGEYITEIPIEKPILNLAIDYGRKMVLAASLDLLFQIDAQYQQKLLFQTNEIGPYQSILSILPYQGLYYLAMSKGFAVYNPETDKARLLTENTFRVSDLIVDTAQTIWLATDQGLFAYQDDSLLHVLPQFIEENLLTIALSDDNRLVIAGASSLFTIDLDKYYKAEPHFLLTYRESAGYEPVEPGQNSFYKDNNGHLWLPTVEHVVKIEAENLLIPQSLPKAKMLVALAINNAYTDTLFFNDTTQLSVASDYNNLEFAFEAVDLDFPESLRFEYMLEGRSNNWISMPDEYKLHFDNLAPGKYNLHVRATRSESFEQVSVAVVRLEVLYPFWLKWWFVSIVLISLTGLLLLIMLQIIRRQRKSQQNQTELMRLRSLALSVQMDNHFLTNNVAKIALLNEKGLNQQASEFSLLLVRFLQKNMHFLRKEWITLQEELELAKAYVALVQKNSRKVELDIVFQNEIDSKSIMVLPFLIQPIIENAIKYGANQNERELLTINLFINLEAGLLSISVVNNLAKSGVKSIGGNHLSLKIIEDRLKIIGGRSAIVINKMPGSFQSLIILDLRKT